MKRRALILGSYNTALDGLFTTAKLHLETPKIVENYIEVDGMHGSLDCCEAVTGTPVYKSRALTAVLETSRGSILERQERIDALIRHAHGKRLPIVHPDYPGRYLMGRIQLQKDFNNLAYGQVSLSAVCEPWFYEMHNCFQTLPILDRSHNCITYDKITKVDELCTATAGFTGDTEMVTVALTTTGGEPRSCAVFRISAEPDCRYYLSGRMSGKGYWRVSSTTEAPESFSPFVDTGADGVFYIFLHRLQSSGVVNLLDVLCLKVDELSVITAGDAPSDLSFRQSADAFTIVSVAGVSYIHNRQSEPDCTIPAGDSVVAAFRRDSTENPGTETVQWRRRWI